MPAKKSAPKKTVTSLRERVKSRASKAAKKVKAVTAKAKRFAVTVREITDAIESGADRVAEVAGKVDTATKKTGSSAKKKAAKKAPAAKKKSSRKKK